jgi:hypothetical protein
LKFNGSATKLVLNKYELDIEKITEVAKWKHYSSPQTIFTSTL